MRDDDQFDEFIESLGGFYRTWLVYLGLELGLFRRIAQAGPAGLTPADLATGTGTQAGALDVWVWAADAHRLIDVANGSITLDERVAAILLDDRVPEHLGGQFVHAVVASMDWDGMADFFRTGVARLDRPDRYRLAIERLTAQDITVFFQEVLAALPQLVADLSQGGRVLDVHCGGGRWLVAMARRFPELTLVGVEHEQDSVGRARAAVAEYDLGNRVSIESGDIAGLGPEGEFDLVYFQYALHQLTDPPDSLRSAWRALRPGGRIVVLDWPLPSTEDEHRSRHGELVAGLQLDEVFTGTRLATREAFVGWFSAAALPIPEVIDLPSGAAAFVVARPVATG